MTVIYMGNAKSFKYQQRFRNTRAGRILCNHLVQSSHYTDGQRLIAQSRRKKLSWKVQTWFSYYLLFSVSVSLFSPFHPLLSSLPSLSLPLLY